MRRRQLLFVTYSDDNLDEGFSYAVELAKAMQEDMVLLLVPKKDDFAKKFEDIMTGVTFAEAGEHETAKEITSPDKTTSPRRYPGKVSELIVEAGKTGVYLSVENTQLNLITGIRNYVKQNAGVDKVVLSPTVTEGEVLTTRDLNRLVRTASRPIVTMTRQAVLHSRNLVQKRSVA